MARAVRDNGAVEARAPRREPIGAAVVQDARSTVTRLLHQAAAGDDDAISRVMPMVYDELHALAERALRAERPDHTLCTTALVHEAYLRLVDQRDARWVARTQFLAVAARVMRRILVDHARAHLAAKRTPGGDRGPLDESRLALPESGGGGVDLLALHETLERLAEADPEAARVVELRFFGGMTVEETAETVGVSPATVKRDWVMAKAWLRRELDRATTPGDHPPRRATSADP